MEAGFSLKLGQEGMAGGLQRGIEPPELSCLPLRVAASEPVSGFVPVQLSRSLDTPIRLELRKGAAAVTVEWPASSAAECGVWLREWLG